MSDDQIELFGRYELLRRLACGGMAEIFLAVLRRDQGFAKQVVLKRILPQFSADAEFVRMFVDEAVLAARLNHPNVVQVHDFGNVDGAYFIAMEYVAGTDLRHVLRANKTADVGLQPAEVAAIGEGLARGLAYVHTVVDDGGQPLRLVHRDVSPHNVLISQQGEVKVTDFGIAKAAARAGQTAAGTLKGKIAYMAPEQAAGHAVDARADQFSLGVVLWECLAGRRLFVGDSDLEVLQTVIRGEVQDIAEARPKTPPALAETVMRMLAFAADDRYPDLTLVARDLARFRLSLGSQGVADLTALVSRSLPEPAGGRPPAVTRRTLPLVDPRPATGDKWCIDESGSAGVVTLAPEPDVGSAPAGIAVPVVSATGRGRRFARLTPLVVAMVFVAAAIGRSLVERSDHRGTSVAMVNVVSRPAGAHILVGEADTGLTTPAGIPFSSAGADNTMKLVLRGYRPFQMQLKDVDGTKMVSAELEPLTKDGANTVVQPGAVASPVVKRGGKGAGWLSLRSSGQWFEVFLGERRLGETPFEHVSVPAGRVVLRLINPETNKEHKMAVDVPLGVDIKRSISFDSAP